MINSTPVTGNSTPRVLVSCRQCGILVRLYRPCWRCGYETPPPWKHRPDVVAKIVNAAWAIRRDRLGS